MKPPIPTTPPALGIGVPEQYAQWHALAILAINDEIKEVEDSLAKWGGDKPAVVIGGTLEGSEGEVIIYNVTLERPLFPPEYTSVELTVGGKITRGVIEAVDPDGRGLTLALDALITGRLDRGTLTFSSTAILKATREELTKAAPHMNATEPKLAGILRVLGLAPVKRVPIKIKHNSLVACKLNKGQRQGVLEAAGAEVHSVFGPPGTGKTKTVGPLVATAAEDLEERVLVVAHTNTALDTAMAAVVEAVGEDMVNEGKVVRLGKPTRDFEHLGITLKDAIRRSRQSSSEEMVDTLKLAEKALTPLAPVHSPEAVRLSGLGPGKIKDVGRRLVMLLSVADMLAIRHRNSPQSKAVESVLAQLRAMSKDMQDLGEATIKQARVVGMTLSKLALQAPELKRFDRVVVDEGSMAMLVQVMLAAGMADKISIFGDPRQLPPVVQSSTKAAKRMLATDIFTHLGLTDPAQTNPLQTVLTEQYRMSPSIRELVSKVFYEGVLTDGSNVSESPELGSSVWLIDTSDADVASARAGSSWINEGHAAIITQMVGELAERELSDVGIITPFAAQRNRIRSDLHARHPRFNRQGFIRTIHGSQGGEKDVIILDLVDAGAPHAISGFLDSRRTEDLVRLLCVAASRARKKLIILAHTQSFRKKYGRKGILMNFLETACRAGAYHRLPEDWRSAGGVALFPKPNDPEIKEATVKGPQITG